MKERLGFPQFCRLRDCRRGKACLGKKLTQVLPRVMGYERDADH
jgi:hypothetical protein